MSQPVQGTWITDPDGYRQKLYDLVGDRDPLEVMAETPAALKGITDANPAETMRARPFEGKWTPNEIIGHLLDADWIYGYRLRLVYSQDDPQILGMDQDLWVSRQSHNDREPAELVADFAAVRAMNLWLWRRVSDSDMSRAGHHNERGPETLGESLKMAAGHDLWHIDQITRYLAALQT